MDQYYGKSENALAIYYWSLFLSCIRHISKILKLSTTVTLLRQLVHFGPWRQLPIKLTRMMRPVRDYSATSDGALLGPLNADAIAKKVRQDSFSVAGVLPQDFITALRAITDKLPSGEYKQIHHVNSSIHALTEDPGIKAVLHRYFKCEPELLEASLWVSGPERGRKINDQNSFHFDYAGWESLTVFVYLTDITENSSYHVVAKGSHRNRTFRDVIRGSLSLKEGERRFGSAIQAIQGSAGTLFFENTEAYHRRHRGNERRVMLGLVYASHRNLLSYGRANPQQIRRPGRKLEIEESGS